MPGTAENNSFKLVRNIKAGDRKYSGGDDPQYKAGTIACTAARQASAPRQKHLDQKLSVPHVTEIRGDWLMSRQQKTYSEQSMIRIIIIHPGHIRKEFTGFHIKF